MRISSEPSEASGVPSPGKESREPRVSVIVTSCNYGHFLRDCIESVLGQTRAPEQLVVVDDGSTDASRRVLDSLDDRVEVVRLGRSRGQAAAFNEGHRRATGDLVLFLDADDLLRPEAIEVVVAHAAPRFPLVFFGLEIVDADGRSTGLHYNSLVAEDGDNLPRLLRSGLNGGEFRFAPTSGNVFSRSFLEWALPMPEEAWRICADAYLVRAAQVWGPVRGIRRVLGAYRVHGGNNYVRSDNFDPWTMQRGERDLKTAALALLSLADHAALDAVSPDSVRLRLALQLRALETLASVAVWSGDLGELRREAKRALAAGRLNRLPLPDRLAAVAYLGRLARAGPRSPLVQALARGERWPGRACIRLHESLAGLQCPRWPESLPLDRTLDFRKPGIARRILADGWSSDMPGQRYWSHGNRAALEFLLPPARGLVSLELSIRIEEPFADEHLEFAVASASRRLWSGPIRRERNIAVTLERDAYLPEQRVRLELCCTRPSDGRQRWDTPLSAPRFTIEHAFAREQAPVAAGGFLRPGAPFPLVQVLAGDPADCGWSVAPDGSGKMLGAEALLHLSLAPGTGPVDLILVLREIVPRGWLSIACYGVDIYSGRTGGTSMLQVPLAGGGRTLASEMVLNFSFTPSDPTEEPLAVAAIGIVELAAALDPHRPLMLRAPERPVLNPGEVVRFGAGGGRRQFLGGGWQEPDGTGVRNAGPEATISFWVAPGLRAPTVELSVAPVDVPPEGHRHVAGVSLGGSMLQTFELLGRGSVQVALGEPVLSKGGEVTLTLHSIHVPLAGGDGSTGVVPATLELESIALQGASDARAQLPDTLAVHPQPSLLRLVDEARDAVHEESLDLLIARRAALAEILWELDPRGLELLVARPERLRAIERLGAATYGAPLGKSEGAVAAQARTTAAGAVEPRERLRVLVVSMLLLPAFKLPFPPDLLALPAILVREPDLVSVYLGRDPEFENLGEVDDYVAYLERLLASVDRILDDHPPESPSYALALRVMRDLWSTKAIFGGANLLRQIRARSRCIEKLLVRAGAPLEAPRRARRGARRLRVGVMVRHLAPSPEAWAVLGMYRHVDRARVDLTLITTVARDPEIPTGDAFARRLRLAGLSEDEAVAAIRALDLDVFILGAYTTKLERVSTIVAHRLARIQVNACFNCPTTLGFRSFDYAFAWRGIEQEGAQDQYSERLVCSDSALQCCFAFTDSLTAEDVDISEVRHELGAVDGTVLLACGAMAHKILPELMDAWARILARSEAGRLVLYPFAACWAMPYSAELFRRRLARRLEAAGVSPARALVLDEQSPERVRRILAACDIYLDSFPYAGATTVCEALSCGVPVVALAGTNLREQTGAAWLRVYGLGDLVARGPDHYVDTAVRLATSTQARAAATAQVRRVLESGRPPHADSAAFGAALSDLLWRVAEESDLFPDLQAMPPTRQDASLLPTSSAAGPGPPAPAVHVEAPDEEVVPAPIRVVVLTVPRSGSTALCHLLAQVSGAEMHFELFHAREIQYSTGPVSDAGALEARDAQPVAFMERVFAEAEGRGARLIGFKFFAFHKKQVLRRIVEDETIRIICLSRSNMLAQYSSRRIAEATGEWERSPGELSQQPQVEFDPEDFEAFEATMRDWASLISTHLAEAGRQALFLEYKSMLSSAGLARLGRFLGVPLPRNRTLPIVQQNTTRTIDRFSNPDVVRRYLDLRHKATWAYGG